MDHGGSLKSAVPGGGHSQKSCSIHIEVLHVPVCPVLIPPPDSLTRGWWENDTEDGDRSGLCLRPPDLNLGEGGVQAGVLVLFQVAQGELGDGPRGDGEDLGDSRLLQSKVLGAAV